MRKYYIFITLLVLFSIGLIVAVILATGSPAKQRALQMDQERLNDFRMITNEINAYYFERDKLPDSLGQVAKQIDYIPFDTKDPETGKPYTYNVTTRKTYELCTTFSLPSEEQTSSAKPEFSYPYMSDLKHKKGYDCIEFTIPNNDDPYGKPAPMPEVNSEPDTETMDVQES